MSVGMTVNYRLAETCFVLSGTVEYETDTFAPTGEERNRSKDTATVAMSVRADVHSEASVNFDRSGSDDDYTIARTVDGRLTAVAFNSAGVGAQVVAGTATAIAFVAGIAARAVGAPIPKIGPTTEGAPPVETPKPTPEEAARAAWDAANEEEAELHRKYTDLLKQAATALAGARADVVNAAKPAAQAAALTRARRIANALAEVRNELDRIESLYRAWRAGTKPSRSEALGYVLALRDLPAYSGAAPDLARLPDRSKAVWDDLGVIVQVERLGDAIAGPPIAKETVLDARITVLTGAKTSTPGESVADDLIRWRIPRPVRIRIWRRSGGGAAVLDSSVPALVVDSECRESSVAIDDRLFGEHSGSIEFGELGAPTKVTQAKKGAVGAFFSALRGAPEAIAAGLDSASKAEASFAGLMDARSARRLAGLKRQLELTQAELDAKGLAATSGDFARLKSLEQQLAIAAAEGTLGRSQELVRLKIELEIAKTEAALAKADDAELEPARAPSIEERIAELEERLSELGVG